MTKIKDKKNKNKNNNQQKPIFNSEGKVVFSKFDFSEEARGGGGEGDKHKKNLDAKAALTKIQKHKEKIKSLEAIGKNRQHLIFIY